MSPVTLSFLLALMPALAQAADDPKALIQRAINASGGAEKLKASTCCYVQTEGHRLESGVRIPYQTRIWQDSSRRFRTEVTINRPGGPQRAVMGAIGDKGWRLSGDEPLVDFSDGERAAQVETNYKMRAHELTPLLVGAEFALTTLGVETIRGRTADGIKIVSSGHPDMQLWFDRASGLVIKTDTLEGGQRVERHFGEFKDFGGLKFATRREDCLAGTTVREWRIVEFRMMQSFDDALFFPPKTAPLPPQNTIRRAIEAAGGSEKLKAAGRCYTRREGTFLQDGVSIPIETRLWRDGLDRYRMETVVTNPTGVMRLVVVRTGDKGWKQISGQPVVLFSADNIEAAAPSRYVNWISDLVPLLEDRGFTLLGQGEETVQGRKIDGIKVTRAGQQDLCLWFDRESAMLIKVVNPLPNGGFLEDHLSDCKEFNGLKRLVRRVCVKNGIVAGYQEREVEFRVLDKLDDALLTPPPAAPTTPPDAANPKEILRLHLEAAGGVEKHKKLPCEYYEQSIKYFTSAGAAEFDVEFWSNYLNSLRQVTTQVSANGRLNRTVVYSDGAGWWRLNNEPIQALDAEAVTTWRSLVNAGWAKEIYPLLDDPTVTLTGLGKQDVRGRTAVGVKVARKGWPEFTLWFDSESHLIVKRDEREPNGMLFEKYMSEYTERDGLKRPTRIEVEQNGQKNSEVRIKDHRHYEKLDPALLARPKE